MVHQRMEEPPARLVRGARRLAPAFLAIVITGAGMVPRTTANAAPAGTGSTMAALADNDDNGPVNEHSGNGRHNKNSFNINSPNFNHGIQHIANTTVSGSTNTQAAFCKKRLRHCKIIQRLVVFDP